jgi:hypothetical protein
MSVVTASSSVLDAGSSPAISTSTPPVQKVRQVRQFEGLPFFMVFSHPDVPPSFALYYCFYFTLRSNITLYIFTIRTLLIRIVIK